MGFDFIEVFDALHTNGTLVRLHNMARNKSNPKPSDKPKTVQRTYRFDTKLFEAFEEDCARHLSNPKRVIEAAILHWLDAGPDTRAAMAKKHREQIGMSRED
jgi:hypothetical protein